MLKVGGSSNRYSRHSNTAPHVVVCHSFLHNSKQCRINKIYFLSELQIYFMDGRCRASFYHFSFYLQDIPLGSCVFYNQSNYHISFLRFTCNYICVHMFTCIATQVFQLIFLTTTDGLQCNISGLCNIVSLCTLV